MSKLETVKLKARRRDSAIIASGSTRNLSAEEQEKLNGRREEIEHAILNNKVRSYLKKVLGLNFKGIASHTGYPISEKDALARIEKHQQALRDVLKFGNKIDRSRLK